LSLAHRLFPDPKLKDSRPAVYEFKLFGFHWYRNTWTESWPQKADGSWTRGSLREVRLPLWPLGLLFAIGIRFVWRKWRRTRRLALGMCVNCGYDLRASVDCCPECGRAIEGRSDLTTSRA
jgi:hypothetical protein